MAIAAAAHSGKEEWARHRAPRRVPGSQRRGSSATEYPELKRKEEELAGGKSCCPGYEAPGRLLNSPHRQDDCRQ